MKKKGGVRKKKKTGKKKKCGNSVRLFYECEATLLLL